MTKANLLLILNERCMQGIMRGLGDKLPLAESPQITELEQARVEHCDLQKLYI